MTDLSTLLPDQDEICQNSADAVYDAHISEHERVFQGSLQPERDIFIRQEGTDDWIVFVSRDASEHIAPSLTESGGEYTINPRAFWVSRGAGFVFFPMSIERFNRVRTNFLNSPDGFEVEIDDDDPRVRHLLPGIYLRRDDPDLFVLYLPFEQYNRHWSWIVTTDQAYNEYISLVNTEL